MSEAGGIASVLLLFFHVLLFSGKVDSATFTILNKCSYTVWPGILSGAGTPPLSTTGFALQPGRSEAISVPSSWSGRLWGRTLCAQNATSGRFACATGDCGSPTVECLGSGAVPPATLAEFTLDGAGRLDFYDVSLVDGYNLPMSVDPRGGKGGNCTATGCAADMNARCPKELQVNVNGGCVACRSACDAFGDPKYCCSGAYATPDTCKPSVYSEFLKRECPRAYSYAYDDGTSTFTCASADYVVTFCPSPSTSVKTAADQQSGVAPASDSSAPAALSSLQASASDRRGPKPPPFVAPFVLAAVWQLLQLLRL
ncbi:thaumatin-like protein 1 [Rhodamnia argentea]|uniref:Thaumatin-like protein 1 n=1 Tax=Rhodamnia argentea TaxID=178133 RepID=A0ABM3GW61_9MYRT|nr:thaumatin-like protein 1 [Rhodamnia argentea]